MIYLLDTNVWIDFARGRVPALLERMDAAGNAAIGMSTITLAELSVGARNSGVADVTRLQAVSKLVTVHPFDRAAAEAYGVLARAVGVRRHTLDRLLAAHALALGLTVVTNNEDDFADIPGLRVENWTR